MVRRDDNLDREKIEAEQNLLIDIQFLIQELIDKNGMSRTELADKAGISKARLSQLMSAEANPTVKSVAAIFNALGEELSISSRPKMATSQSVLERSVPQRTSDWRLSFDYSTTTDVVDEVRLVAVVKESVASNDNFRKQVVEWDNRTDSVSLKAA